MTTITDNPQSLDLGLTDEEDTFVRDTAWRIHRVSYLNSLDNAILVARAIGIVRERFYGRGRQGGFDAALIRYGYVSRDGTRAISPTIRTQLRELLENETEVRAWWFTLSDKSKRHWLSPSSIHRQFMKWKRRGSPQLKHNRGAALADQLAACRDEIDDLKERLGSAHSHIHQLESELGETRVREAEWISPLQGEKRHWVLNWQQRKKRSSQENPS
jgi:hypothetical protein